MRILCLLKGRGHEDGTHSSIKGFTLIELVIVLIILGVLAAIAIPKFSSLREEANDVAIATIINSANTALVIAMAEDGRPPTVRRLVEQFSSKNKPRLQGGTLLFDLPDGHTHKIETFRDHLCRGPRNRAARDIVNCLR